MNDVVNVGTLPDDGTGDVDRDAFIAINQALAPLLLHVVDLGNPHAVTARQVGAYSKVESDQNLQAALQGLPTLTNVALAISTAIGALSLGSAASKNAGSSAGNVPVLDSMSKLSSSLFPDALLGAVRYQGGWNASTNTPNLPTPAAANKGFYYIVTAAGSSALAGQNGPITDWQIGDWAVSDGTFWEKVDSSDQVISVAGLQGVVTALALTAALIAFTGDSGSGGTKGHVPAPAPGDAAAGKVLGAGGAFILPPSSGLNRAQVAALTIALAGS